MQKITYGLMEKATQEFMGMRGQGEFMEPTFTMYGSKRFESDNLLRVVSFIKAEPLGKGSSNYRSTDGYDPNEFVPVAFIRNENGFKKDEDVKIVELPNIVSVNKISARDFKGTPKKLLDFHFTPEQVEAMAGFDAEIFVVVPREKGTINPGDFLYFDRYDSSVSEVKFALPVPDDWPIHDRDFERKGWQFLVVDRSLQVVAEKSKLIEIEPLENNAGPGL